MPSIETALVLGAYGLAGREVVAGLLAKTDLAVIATGRSPQKLEALASRLADSRLTTRGLDAYDSQALARACADADLVINAVGPYAVGGGEIARTTLESGRAYVDFANEQGHYHRLEPLGALAREKDLLLLTAAGAIPGLSTLVVLQAAEQLPDVQHVDVFYAQGRPPDEESGLGSFLGGVLELSFLGRRIERRVEPMPEPFGEAQMISIPSIEALTVPKQTPVRSLENWWAMGEVPPGADALLRLLKPHERDWARRLFERLMRWTLRGEYRRGVKRGLTTAGVIKVAARAAEGRWEGTMHVEDGGLATAYLPVLAAKRLAEGRLEQVGLLTPIDVFDPSETFRELSALGWRAELQVSSPTRS
jgi:hypothetical protein